MQEVTTNDLLGLMGYVALAILCVCATFFAFIFGSYLLAITLLVFTFYTGRQGDNKYNEIRTKLGLG